MWIKRQIPLAELKKEQKNKPHEIKNQKTICMFLPVHIYSFT
jgi:hypothetical protein